MNLPSNGFLKEILSAEAFDKINHLHNESLNNFIAKFIDFICERAVIKIKRATRRWTAISVIAVTMATGQCIHVKSVVIAIELPGKNVVITERCAGCRSESDVR